MKRVELLLLLVVLVAGSVFSRTYPIQGSMSDAIDNTVSFIFLGHAYFLCIPPLQILVFTL